MMRILVPALVFAATAVFAHFFVLTSLPGFIMSKAHQTFESQGVPTNRWVSSPRQTPETQRIVRPSPDLAYAICRFDTAVSPVFINAPLWDGYGSLSIFDSQTDNVFVASLDADSDFNGIYVTAADQNSDLGTSITLDGRGIAVIRRLAPTQALYDEAASLVFGATCEQTEVVTSHSAGTASAAR